MSLVLRVDVDKPYGRANIIEKVLSKVSESYWLPSISAIGYLKHLKIFLTFLSEHNIRAHIYFRKCTLPPNTWFNESLLDRHMIGLHAENTRSYDTLSRELDEMQKYFHPINISSFTKHGSGTWKSGRHHYPAYEPDKYLKWAERLENPFMFGNEEVYDVNGFHEENNYYPGMFWIDRYFSNGKTPDFQWIINYARDRNVIVIIHPSNFVADKRVKANMQKLISMASQEEVSWVTL